MSSVDPSDAMLARHMRRLMTDAGWRVSVFHNPGSLLRTVTPFVECHAVQDGRLQMTRVTSDADDAEYQALVSLAVACGFEIQE